jgi:hypothetical protein
MSIELSTLPERRLVEAQQTLEVTIVTPGAEVDLGPGSSLPFESPPPPPRSLGKPVRGQAGLCLVLEYGIAGAHMTFTHLRDLMGGFSKQTLY